MHRLILVATVLLLAGCNSRGQWENEQAELANEASPSAQQANDVTATAPAANDVNAVAGNDVNATTTDANSAAPANEAAPSG